MSRARLAQLDRHIEEVIAPALARLGFSPSPRRSFHRNVSHEGTVTTQIVEVQVGVRSMAGRVTINLGVFNAAYLPSDWPAAAVPPLESNCLPSLRERLGRVMRPSGWLARIGFGGRDRWWRQSDSDESMRRTCEAMRTALMDPGLAWLEQQTSRTALETARAAVEAARRRIT
jgi:hypothetical protein